MKPALSDEDAPNGWSQPLVGTGALTEADGDVTKKLVENA